MSIELVNLVKRMDITGQKFPYTYTGRDGSTKTGNIMAASLKAVLGVYADHAHSLDDPIAWPSHGTIELHTGIRRQTVVLIVRAAEQNGFLEYTGQTRRGVKVYRLNIEKLLSLQADSSPNARWRKANDASANGKKVSGHPTEGVSPPDNSDPKQGHQGVRPPDSKVSGGLTAGVGSPDTNLLRTTIVNRNDTGKPQTSRPFKPSEDTRKRLAVLGLHDLSNVPKHLRGVADALAQGLEEHSTQDAGKLTQIETSWLSWFVEQAAGDKRIAEIAHAWFQYAALVPTSQAKARDWLATFRKWAEHGAGENDVRNAIKAAEERGWQIARPGSITWAIEASVAERRRASRAPKTTMRRPDYRPASMENLLGLDDEEV